MTAPEFLEVDAVVFLHDQAIRDYGGMQGLKSEDLLHSALSRPMNKLTIIRSTMPTNAQLGAAACCSCT